VCREIAERYFEFTLGFLDMTNQSGINDAAEPIVRNRHAQPRYGCPIPIMYRNPQCADASFGIFKVRGKASRASDG